MDKEAKINIGFLIIFIGLLLGLLVYPVVAAAGYAVSNNEAVTLNITRSDSVGVYGQSSGNQTINEDIPHTFNFTVNWINGSNFNLTGVNITFPTNFTYTAGTNKTGRFNQNTTYGDFNYPGFTNITSNIITIAGVNSTSVLIQSANGSVATPTSAGQNGSVIMFNLTAGTPGKYNITVELLWNYTNASAFKNQTNISIIVNDTTPPDEINVTESNSFGLNRSYANVSGTMVINVSIADNGNFTQNLRATEINYVNISFFNGSDYNSSYSAINKSSFSYRGNYWDVSINTANISDGVYNVTIAANDTLNNVNITNISNMRVDNTKPTGSASCTPSKVNSGDTVTCSCSPSDVTSGVNSSATSITASPSTVNTGTFTETCTFADMAGNTGSIATTYTVELSGGGGGGGAGSVEAEAAKFYTKTIPVVAQEFKDVEIITQQLSAKERIKVKIDEVIHFVGVREITATSAIIEVASDPVQVELQVGEDTKVDVNDDKFYDVYVKLNAIVNGKADLVIKYLHEEYTPTPEEEAAREEGAPIGEGEKANLTWLWILIVVVVIVVIAYFVWKMKR